MGLPAVVIATEQFEKLAKVIMKSQHVPETVMILIKGNPEFISDDELNRVSDRVLEEAVEKLTRKQPQISADQKPGRQGN